MKGLRTGVDLGGTKIEAIVLDPDGAELARNRIAAPRDDYDKTLHAVADLIHRTENDAGGTAPRIGIASPGTPSPVDGLIRNANSTPLNGHALDRDLSALLKRPVRHRNDADCFALAEAQAGAARDARVVLGVILGTGVGGGIVIDGEPLVGRNRIGSEWGHNPLAPEWDYDAPAPLCKCGRHGCVEAWCSGPALAADHLRVTGSDMPAQMIAQFAAAGDMAAQETLDRHLARLARALAAVVNILDPDVIVLGGGLSKLTHLYAALPDAMRPHIFSDSFDTPIRCNELGDSAGVVGAAWLWPLEETS